MNKGKILHAYYLYSGTSALESFKKILSQNFLQSN